MADHKADDTGPSLHLVFYLSKQTENSFFEIFLLTEFIDSILLLF